MIPTLSSLQQKLDAVDKAQRALRDCPGDRAEIFKALETVPQFVVVGMQSSGKSSVLSRLSGIPLPTANVRCTKLPIMLKLRRADENHPPTIFLRGIQQNNEPYETSLEELAPGTEVSRILELQELALALSGVTETGFAENFTVELEVRGKNLPNMTLIDLPGLPAPDPTKPDEAPTAERIVKRFAEMSGSLILAIVPVHEDFGNVLGKAIMHAQREKMILVGTNVDKLMEYNKKLEEVSKRLEDVIGYSEDQSRFLLVGNASSNETEQQQLTKYVHALLVNFELGLSLLSDEIQRRTEQHLKLQIPKAINVISQQISTTQSGLDKIKKSTPMSDLNLALKHLKIKFNRGAKDRLDTFRGEREKLAVKLKNLKLRPLCKPTNPQYLRRADPEEDLFVGALVNVAMAGTTVPGVVLDVHPTQCLVQIEKEDTPLSFPHDRIFSNESSSTTMMDDIKKICIEIQGLRTLSLIDPQPVIERYAADWAKRYEPLLKLFLAHALEKISQWLEEVFSVTDLPKESSKDAVLELYADMKKRVVRLKNAAEIAIARLVSYQDPPLVFTTNEHYYQSCYRAYLDADETALTDEGGAGEKLCQVRAYLKTQGKVIIEVAAKDLIGILLRNMESAFEAVVDMTNAEKFVHLVVEPRQVERKREMLEVTLKGLNEAKSFLEPFG